MTYSELKTTIADYLDRRLDQWETQIEGFIRSTEAVLNRELRVGQMTTRAYATGKADQVWYPLPVDYLACRSIKVDDQALDYLTPQQVTRFLQSLPNRPSRYFTIEAQQFRIVPGTDDDAYIEITYYQRIPSLNNTDQTTNWVLNNEFDLYYYGALAEAQRFFKNQQELAYWEGLFAGRIGDVVRADKQDRWTAAPASISVKR